MQPKTITLLICFFTSIASYAQNAFNQDDFQKTVRVTDVEGRPFVNPSVDVSGTQFFIEQWKYGSILLYDKAVFNHIPVKMNLQTQQVHYMGNNKTEMYILPELVKELFIYDTLGGQPVVYNFQSGFPAFEKLNEYSFYLVLSQGKSKLLKSIQKDIAEESSGLGSEIKKEFTAYERYFFYENNKLQQVRLNKSSILQVLHDQQPKVEDFVMANGLSYKSENDLKRMVDFYNGL
jgi:hypothetical protein